MSTKLPQKVLVLQTAWYYRAGGIAPRVHLVNLIRKNPKPTLSDDMVLLVRAGQEVPLEPVIFNNLTATGIWDQRPFLKLIQDHAFGLIILAQRGGEVFTSEIESAVQKQLSIDRTRRELYSLSSLGALDTTALRYHPAFPG
jgi:hypothetical protein